MYMDAVGFDLRCCQSWGRGLRLPRREPGFATGGEAALRPRFVDTFGEEVGTVPWAAEQSAEEEAPARQVRIAAQPVRDTKQSM